MSIELILWLFSFASIMLICLSDLEFDYINPYDSSSRINSVVLIEYALQGALCASFLLTLHWFPFLVMAPVAYYHGKLYMDRKHLVDVTEIFRQLNWEKKYRMIKLAFYFSLFIITIYSEVKLVVCIIEQQTNTASL
uniref:Cornichon family protein n=3 Tax=Oryza TaxID=4527 RepID=A0A0E0RHP3_ORYRU